MSIETDINTLTTIIARKRMKAEFAALSETLNLSVGEHALFQEKKSLAQQDGRLSLDDAMIVYTLLGHSPGVFNAQPVAAKMVLTSLFMKLLS